MNGSSCIHTKLFLKEKLTIKLKFGSYKICDTISIYSSNSSKKELGPWRIWGLDLNSYVSRVEAWIWAWTLTYLKSKLGHLDFGMTHIH